MFVLFENATLAKDYMSFFDTYVVMKVSLKILLTWSKMLSRLQITRLNRQDEFFFHF